MSGSLEPIGDTRRGDANKAIGTRVRDAARVNDFETGGLTRFQMTRREVA